MDTNEHALILCDLTHEHHSEVLDLWRRAGLSVRPVGRDASAAFARQLRSGQQRVIGLRDGPRLVAATVLTHDGRKGWINRLAVDPAYRRQSLAVRLIVEAERWFTQDVGLEVWAALIEEENQASRAFFDAVGFHRHDVVYVSKRTRSEA